MSLPLLVNVRTFTVTVRQAFVDTATVVLLGFGRLRIDAVTSGGVAPGN
jgi:hypothetical protein